MKRGVVFIFSLFFISSFIFSCSSSSENGSSGGINYIYGEPEVSAKEVTGIKIAGNHIELLKEMGGGNLTYNIGASALPDDAENKALQYTSDNEDLAEVSGDGIVTIKDVGAFTVTIQSVSNKAVSQTVSFNVRDNVRTDLDKSSPLSFFGIYSISQYGIDESPNKNVGGSFSFNADRKSDTPLSMSLLFNGLAVPMAPELEDTDFSKMSYEDVATTVFDYLKYEIKDNKTVIISFTAQNHPELVENGIIKGEETLKLSLKKERDFIPGIVIAENPVAVTEIEAGDLVIDRRYNTSDLLKTEVLPVNADNKAVTYKSSDERVAKVSPIGEVTAMGDGQAEITITAVSDNTVIAKPKVTVKDTTVRVKDIKFQKHNNVIYLDTNGRAKDSITVKAVVEPENATYKSVYYYSKTPQTASVDSASGKVTPRRKGKVTIAAVSDNGAIEKTTEFNVDVEKVVVPVKAIINVPARLDMSIDKSEPIKLDAKAVPTYADDTSLLYTGDDSGHATVDENGLIRANTVGRSVITVSSKKYPDIKKEITVDVRQVEDKIYITAVNLNDAPSTLYIDYKGDTIIGHTVIPEIVPANANMDTGIEVSSDAPDIAEIKHEESGYKVVPHSEGNVIITVKTANGVVREVPFTVKKVMNVKGHYKVDKVKYSLGDKTEIFMPDADNLQGEFAIDLLEDKYQVRGRLQLTPAQPLQSYTFNNWRYIYAEKDIALVDANEDGTGSSEPEISEQNDLAGGEDAAPAAPDIYANQTKDVLEHNNIKITGEKTIEYIYTDESFQAVIYLTKINDELMTAEDGTRKEILDRTMYMTPVDMEKDPYSAKGYYEMTWFYGNPYNQSKTGYQPKFSHNENDRPINSDLGINYLSNGRKCKPLLISYTCMGGKGDGGSVQSYKGAFAVKVDGTEENANLSSIMKVQMNGHEDVDVDWQKYLQFMHVGFGSLPLTQMNNNKLISNDKSLKSSISSKYSIYNKSNQSETTTLAYTFLPNNTMQFEMKFHDNDWYVDKDKEMYEMMYRAVKVSDRYIELTEDKFASFDRNQSIPADTVIAVPPYENKNAVPDLAQIVPLEDFTGTVTPIE